MTSISMTFAALGLLLGTAVANAQAPSWTVPAENERCPSKWGAGDERGSGNHMKPQTVLNAARLIKTGELSASPLSQSVGVMLADNSVCWYLRKGAVLPARNTVSHATTTTLRRGQSFGEVALVARPGPTLAPPLPPARTTTVIGSRH